MGIDWNSILNQILAVLVPTVIAALGILGSIVLNRLRAKLAASEAVDKDTLIKSAAVQGVHKAEEVSAEQYSKTGVALTGTEKGAIATEMVQKKAPDTLPDDAKSAVKAAVGATPGVGASGTPPLLEPDGRPLGWELTAEAKQAHKDEQAVGGGRP